jgi:hypothetical protein
MAVCLGVAPNVSEGRSPAVWYSRSEAEPAGRGRAERVIKWEIGIVNCYRLIRWLFPAAVGGSGYPALPAIAGLINPSNVHS